MAEGVDEFYDAGYARLEAGDYAGALSLFDAALAADPSNERGLWGELWDYKGCALIGLLRHAEAVEAFEQAVALYPRCPEFLVDLADALSTIGDSLRATAAYERAREHVLPGESLGERIAQRLDRLSRRA